MTNAEYDAILKLAEPLTVSAWARRVLVSASHSDPLLVILLAELLALRTILVNLDFTIAKDGPPTVEGMRFIIETADNEKFSKANERIARLRPAVNSTRR